MHAVVVMDNVLHDKATFTFFLDRYLGAKLPDLLDDFSRSVLEVHLDGWQQLHRTFIY